MTREEWLDRFRALARAVLQKYEREAASRRAYWIAGRLPSVQAARLDALEQQLAHDGSMLDGALEELADFLYPSGGNSQ